MKKYAAKLRIVVLTGTTRSSGSEQIVLPVGTSLYWNFVWPLASPA